VLLAFSKDESSSTSTFLLWTEGNTNRNFLKPTTANTMSSGPNATAPALASQRNKEGLLFTFYYNNAMELKYLTQKEANPPEDHFIVVEGRHITGRSSPIACTTASDVRLPLLLIFLSIFLFFSSFTVLGLA
jgi:hypothetical protein